MIFLHSKSCDWSSCGGARAGPMSFCKAWGGLTGSVAKSTTEWAARVVGKGSGDQEEPHSSPKKEVRCLLQGCNALDGGPGWRPWMAALAMPRA